MNVLSDKMHEPYRLPQIYGAEHVKEFAKENNLPVFLSGSGSTMMIIFKGEVDFSKLKDLGWELKVLNIDTVGATYEE